MAQQFRLVNYYNLPRCNHLGIVFLQDIFLKHHRHVPCGSMRRGLAFDAFGRTEDLARQAAATVLAMFTISGALSVPRKNGGENGGETWKRWEKLGQKMETIGNLWEKPVGKDISGKHAGNINGKHMGNIWEKLKENIERWETCGNHVGRMWQNRWQTCRNTLGRIWKNRKHTRETLIWDIHQNQNHMGKNMGRHRSIWEEIRKYGKHMGKHVGKQVGEHMEISSM